MANEKSMRPRSWARNFEGYRVRSHWRRYRRPESVTLCRTSGHDVVRDRNCMHGPWDNIIQWRNFSCCYWIDFSSSSTWDRDASVLLEGSSRPESHNKIARTEPPECEVRSGPPAGQQQAAPRDFKHSLSSLLSMSDDSLLYWIIEYILFEFREEFACVILGWGRDDFWVVLSSKRKKK